MADTEGFNSDQKAAFNERWSVRGCITKLVNDGAFKLNGTISRIEAKIIIVKLDRYEANIKELDTIVLAAYKDDKLRNEKAACDKYLDSISDIRVMLQERIEDAEIQSADQAQVESLTKEIHDLKASQQSTSTQGTVVTQAVTQEVNSPFRLPSVSLRIFDGSDITRYYPWLDDLELKIEKNAKLSVITRFDYLL